MTELFYRRKGKSIVIEGKKDGKSLFIWTLPKPKVLISKYVLMVSELNEGKKAKIRQKMQLFEGCLISEQES